MRTRVLNIIRVFAVSLILLAIASYVALQTSVVQTFLVGALTERFNNMLGGKVSVAGVYFRFFNYVLLEDVCVKDDAPKSPNVSDTLFHARKISAAISLRSLFSDYGPTISMATIEDARMNLVIEVPDTLGGAEQYTNNLSRIFRLSPETPDRPPREGKIFEIRSVRVKDFTFTMYNLNYERQMDMFAGGINWYDMSVTDIDLDVRDMKMVSGVMYGTLVRGSFREKSGFSCRNLSGHARVGNGLTSITELNLRDDYSDMYIDEYLMRYASTESFSDYVNSVEMGLRIDSPCTVDMRTLAFFAPSLKGADFAFSVSGSAYGPVSALYTEGLNLTLERTGLNAQVAGSITGLPDFASSLIDARISVTDFTTASLAGAVRQIVGKDLLSSVTGYAKGMILSLDASMRGVISDFCATGNITADGGMLGFHVDATGLGVSDELGIDGEVFANSLDVGKVLGTGFLGPLSFYARADSRISHGLEGSYAEIDTLTVSSFVMNGYEYRDIDAVGKLANRSFDGRILSKDPNLKFMFQGLASLEPMMEGAEYRFMARVPYVNLNALNFDNRWDSELSFVAKADFRQGALGDVKGFVNIYDLMLMYDGKASRLGNVTLNSNTELGEYSLELVSDFVKAEYSATAPLTSFFSDLVGASAGMALPSLFEAGVSAPSGGEYALEITTGDTRSIAPYIMPGLYVEDNSRLSVSVDSNSVLSASFVSGRVAKGEDFLRNVVLTVNSPDSTLTAILRASRAKVASLNFDSPSVTARAKNDEVSLNLSYYNADGAVENSADMNLDALLSRDSDGLLSKLLFKESMLVVNGNEWRIAPSSVLLSDSFVKADSLIVRSGEQSLMLNSPSSDTLNLSLSNFDISSLNDLLGEGYALNGRLSGVVSLLDLFADSGLLMDIKGQDVSVAGNPVGSLTLMSKWDETNKRFNIFAKNSLDGASTFNISGFVKNKPSQMSITASLNSMSAGYFKPLLSSFASDVSGTISGNLHLGGSLSSPELVSEGLRVDELMLEIDYTKVPYWLNGPVTVDGKGVSFDQVSIRDRFSNTGYARGGILYDNFSNIRFDTHLYFTRLECLNIAADQADAFYGNAFASGRLDLTGPLSALTLYADATTYDRTGFHLPLGATADASSNSILTFRDYSLDTSHTDPYEEMLKSMRGEKTSAADLKIGLHLNVTPSAKVFVELDQSSGSMLSGQGAGVLDINVEPSKDLFEIRGDYTIRSGNFRFVALNIASRDFSIEEGSRINFGGDVLESTLNINATYSTKASVGTLIADTSSVSTRRLVNCGINVSGKLLNPTLKFSIDIPDLDPTVQYRVQNALSTEDKVQKQFLSLIISNGFLPDERSSIVNNTSLLYSSVSEIMSGQLNSIFQTLNIPLDLGVNYQQTERGNDLFDVAVSTQLFNNRVVVNGNIGNRQYKTGATNSDVVGDVDIEIKLNKSGNLRLNIFSHSADSYSSYLDQSQRNGIGVAYQQEFSTFKELFQKLFWSRKRRQQAEEETLRQQMTASKENDVTITIE